MGAESEGTKGRDRLPSPGPLAQTSAAVSRQSAASVCSPAPMLPDHFSIDLFPDVDSDVNALDLLLVRQLGPRRVVQQQTSPNLLAVLQICGGVAHVRVPPLIDVVRRYELLRLSRECVRHVNELTILLEAPNQILTWRRTGQEREGADERGVGSAVVVAGGCVLTQWMLRVHTGSLRAQWLHRSTLHAAQWYPPLSTKAKSRALQPAHANVFGALPSFALAPVYVSGTAAAPYER
jgi:hypothetical protein